MTNTNGRPTALTPDVQHRILQALQLGNYRKDAAQYAGVDPTTLHRWVARGRREPDSEYGALREAVLEAESKAKIAAMGCITRSARDGDWRASAWYLERKYPHEFSERSQLFLVAKAFEQVEQAAESAGMDVPDSVWHAAWLNVAEELAVKLPSTIRPKLTTEEMEDELDDLEVDATDRDAVFRILHADKVKNAGAES